jgi:hypothetical protein
MYSFKLNSFAICGAMILLILPGSALAEGGKQISKEASAIVREAIDSLKQQYENQSPEAGEEINWKCLSSGGAKSSDGTFIINGTLGQLAVGTSTDGTSDTHHGYWQNFETKWDCGDVNMSGFTDIDDIIFLVAYIFLGGPPPVPLSIANANCIDEIDIDDVMYIVSYVFLGGPLPCDPNDDGIPDCP